MSGEPPTSAVQSDIECRETASECSGRFGVVQTIPGNERENLPIMRGQLLQCPHQIRVDACVGHLRRCQRHLKMEVPHFMLLATTVRTVVIRQQVPRDAA